ncbi:MAG: FapA family protein [Oscillospiraceae bacterium]|nr:FapA family protein [Oscillospiraceae bacterium]
MSRPIATPATQALDMPVSPEIVPPTKPVIIVKVIQGGMEASLLLHPTGPNTLPPTREDLNAALSEQGVVFGLNDALLKDLCKKPAYYHVFIIARGKPAATGDDGYVKYLVSSAFVRRPKIRDDGTADYKNIGFPPVVFKQQPLCEIYPAQKGADGMNVYGQVLEGKYGRAPLNPCGDNTFFSADKSRLYAEIDGRVKIQHGVVSIIKVLEIDENVDNATGNIDFTGDVLVAGDVVSGFSIKCGGSIVVHGTVEGATLEAGTDISVSAGMFGMDKGLLNAGGNIKCRFIQNCSVRATGNIYADSVMFSNVECEGDLELTGSKGALIGGKISVAGKIIARTVGTSMHVPTDIIFTSTGTDKVSVVERLETEIRGMQRNLLKTRQMMARYEDMGKKSGLTDDQINEIIAARERYDGLVNEMYDKKLELDTIKREQEEAGMDRSYLECRGKIHVNTKFIFGSEKLLVTETISNARVQLTKDGISIFRM